MIIDFHTHIFPSKIRDKRELYFKGEPAFKLLYDSPKSNLVGADNLIQMMDTQGVDRSVVFGFPWKNADHYRYNNDYIIKSVSEHHDRLTGFACFDVSAKDASVEAERCLDAGLKGVGELAFYQSGIDGAALSELEPVMEICKNRDLPVLIHTNEPVGHIYPGKTPVTLHQIYTLAKNFPENKIVLAHWGGGIFFYALLKKEVKETLKNIYYDTAASPFLYDSLIYKTASDLAGHDKILMGTDYPLIKPDRYFRELEKTSLTDKQKTDICGLNAARLLGIDPAT